MPTKKDTAKSNITGMRISSPSLTEKQEVQLHSGFYSYVEQS